MAVGAVGMGFSLLLFLVASFRLGKFCQAYGWKLREVMGDSFGRKRLSIHLLLVIGTCFVIPLYALLLHTHLSSSSSTSTITSPILSSVLFTISTSFLSSPSSSTPSFCLGLLSLLRFQLLCTLAALGLVLSDWRIDVYEAPLLRARRVWMYQIRDAATAGLLVVAFLLNVAGPAFCLDKRWAEENEYIGDDSSTSSNSGGGTAQAYVVDAAYLVQLACAFLLMLSMLYSGLQMKKRLVWASRSPLRQHDLFRIALLQLNILLAFCMAAFCAQVITLAFNYVQLVVYHRTLLPDIWLWVVGAWFPLAAWSASCLYLARKAKRAYGGREGGREGGMAGATPREREYAQALLGREGAGV
ncbi:Hypothetical protein NocV09_04100200 [Nannochloropsis oceanica]